MSRFLYNGQVWKFENEVMSVSMDDATFQKYLNTYLTSEGIDTRTYLQLLAYVDQVLNQRIEAATHLENPEYWRDIGDPYIRVIIHGRLQGQGRS
jgi:hypothetical protein